MSKIHELKNWLKELAKNIREEKRNCKEHQRQHKGSGGYNESRLKFGLWNHSHPSVNFRHHHIAYCLLRGRTFEQIENVEKHDSQSYPDMCKIKLIMEEFKDEETLRSDQS